MLTGCAKTQRDLHKILPETIPSGWVREDQRAMTAEDAPQFIRDAGLNQWMQASYRGTGRITVKIYELKSETNAFELMQKWRRDKDETAFYKGPLFVTAAAATNEARPVLDQFTRDLQSKISSDH